VLRCRRTSSSFGSACASACSSLTANKLDSNRESLASISATKPLMSTIRTYLIFLYPGHVIYKIILFIYKIRLFLLISIH
jgi:hypothetical protein